MSTKALRLAGPVLIVMAPLTYFLGLHPSTGSIGGIVFLLSGWILPDLFWLGLGLLVVSFLPPGKLLQTLLGNAER